MKYHVFCRVPTLENKLPVDTLVLASKPLSNALQTLGGYHIRVGRLTKGYESTDLAKMPEIILIEAFLGRLSLK